MNKGQQSEWTKAQKIAVSVDLVEAAKKHLKFLAAVDRNRFLYEDPALRWAIYRYIAYWLPLLAMHLEKPLSEEPLVAPLDCECIWHCHRLNPVRYKLDCEKLFGRILGNRKIVSSVEVSSKNTTEKIWNELYPEEPYELDINRSFSGNVMQTGLPYEKSISYDLASAVKRQIPFTFQVSRPCMSDDLFLQEAVARYKGFLHLIRTNRKAGVHHFCVPTYDIDLIWHVHQLYPDSYCRDLIRILGKVLEHDDTYSSRTQGNRVDTGFYETTRQWENTYGIRYWKAGAMYRGNPPTPVTQVPLKLDCVVNDINALESCDKPAIHFSAGKAVEILMEFVEIRNVPEVLNKNLHVSFCKKESDKFFNKKRSLSILSESGDKQVADFLCEPTGEFLLELTSHSPPGVLGSCSLSLEGLLASSSQLSVDKWLSLNLVPGLRCSKPILLHVSISFTPPSPAPQVLHLAQTQPFCKHDYFFEKYCFHPFLNWRKGKHSKIRINVTDNDGKCVCSLQMRDKVKKGKKCTPETLKEIQYIPKTGEKRKVAILQKNNWIIDGMHGPFKLIINSGQGDHLFELSGRKKVKLFPGKRLEFEPRLSGNQRCYQDFITAVEFSADYPYGRASALFDLKLGTMKALDEWVVQPGIILTFILPDILRQAGYIGLSELSLNDCNSEKSKNCRPIIHPVNCGDFGGSGVSISSDTSPGNYGGHGIVRRGARSSGSGSSGSYETWSGAVAKQLW